MLVAGISSGLGLDPHPSHPKVVRRAEPCPQATWRRPRHMLARVRVVGTSRSCCWRVFVVLRVQVVRVQVVRGESVPFVLLRLESVLVRGALGKRAGRCWCVGKVLLAHWKLRWSAWE